MGAPQIPSPGSSCSLNNWLSLIKNHADLEEEHDFEIFDNSRCKKMKDPSLSSSSTHPEVKKWLSPNNSSSCSTPPSNLFDHIPKGSRAWLLQVCQQLSNLEEMKQVDPFQ